MTKSQWRWVTCCLQAKSGKSKTAKPVGVTKAAPPRPREELKMVRISYIMTVLWTLSN